MAVHSARTIDCISLCTGGGGLDLGVGLAMPAARTICMVEREAPAAVLLVAAMEAGLLDPAPVWSDVRTLDARAWRGRVDGVFGGIPCQPHSVAGKRLGRDDPRDLWSAARRIVVGSGAWWVLIENVPGMLTTGGAERVVGDLGRFGFECEIGLFSAAEVGASHERARLFILDVSDGDRSRRRRPGRGSVADRRSETARRPQFGRLGSGLGNANAEGQPQPRWDLAEGGGWSGDTGLPFAPPGPGDAAGWHDVIAIAPHLAPATESLVRRVADGLAAGMDTAAARDVDRFRPDRLRLLGNGVHPLAAAHALRTLATRLARRSAGAAELVRLMEAPA